MFKFLIKFFLDETGEYTPPAGRSQGNSGQGQGNANANEGGDNSAPPADDKAGDDQPPVTDTENPPQPKYGEFGDNPDAVWEAHQKTMKDIEGYRGKLTATERNLSATRKALEKYGINLVPDGQGGMTIQMQQEQSQRQRRFTDKHKELFDEPVLNAIKDLVVDQFEDLWESQTKTQTQREQQVRQFQMAKQESNGLMLSYFPQLRISGQDGTANPNFNQSFYDRATEIWESRYQNDPRGELIAAMQAAQELKIPLGIVEQAKKEGFAAGKNDKKIIGPVNSGTAGVKKGGVLSKEEYLKLNSDQRAAYDAERALK